MNAEDKVTPNPDTHCHMFRELPDGDIFADYTETEARRQERKRSRKFKHRHAEQLALALMADLRQVRAAYGPPLSDARRDSYYDLFLEAFQDRWVRQFEFGYERFSVPVVAWRYTMERDEKEWHSDQPGHIDTTLPVPEGSSFFLATREVPFINLQRWDVDHHYLAGDTHVCRQVLRQDH